MRISASFNCQDPDGYIQELNVSCRQAARQLTAYYGIPILIICNKHPDKETLYHFYFKIDQHVFETLSEVERALKNKALL